MGVWCKSLKIVKYVLVKNYAWLRKYLPLILSFTNSKRRAMFDKCNLNLRHLTSFAPSVFKCAVYFLLLFPTFFCQCLSWSLDPTTNSKTRNHKSYNQSDYFWWKINNKKTNNTWKTYSHCKKVNLWKLKSKVWKLGVRSWIWWTRHLFWITELSQEFFWKQYASMSMEVNELRGKSFRKRGIWNWFSPF